jgi:photoactive yellow protein
VLSYSLTGSEIANRDPKDVVGQNFFNGVAPCTRGPEVHGHRLDGARSGRLSVVFDRVSDDRMNPTRMRVRRNGARTRSDYWFVVKRL